MDKLVNIEKYFKAETGIILAFCNFERFFELHGERRVLGAHFDGIVRLIKILKDMRKKYILPLKAIIIDFERDGTLGTAIAGVGIIFINSDILLPQYRSQTNLTTLRGVLAHEVGHLIHFDPIRFAGGRITEIENYRELAMGISDYAGTSNEEFFAELFAKKNTGKLSERQLEIYRQVYGDFELSS